MIFHDTWSPDTSFRQPSKCPKLAYRNLSQSIYKQEVLQTWYMLRVQLDRQLVQIDFWHPQHSRWNGISAENEFVASTEATQKQNESYATATVMEPYFKTLRGHKALGFLKWPSCSWRSIVPLPSSSISAKTSAFASWNMTSSTNFNKTAPQERLELLYFECSPPWHVGWRLSGEGCQWEYDRKNGEFENIDFRFPC